jgi:hypothetical protein
MEQKTKSECCEECDDCITTERPPLLCPFWSRNIVQSSMEPNGANIILTSLSEHFLEIIPTNNFLSSEKKKLTEIVQH